MRVDQDKSLVIGKMISSDNKIVVIHNVHILDASGSMSGGKYNNSVAGIQEEVEKLRKDNSGIKYTQTFVEFEQSRIDFLHFMEPIEKCEIRKGRTGGGTPLLDAIGMTLSRLKENVKPGEEKTVVTIATDGAENFSTKWKAHQVKDLIKDLEDNYSFNVNYMCTAEDEEVIKRLLDAKEGNTFVHNNTASGMSAAYITRRESVSSYSKNVLAGASDEELSRGFFKK